MDIRKQIGNAQRIVVKVGTSTLLHPNGKINLYRIEHLARELADLASQGREVILVTSGAIGVGMLRMGLSQRPDSPQEKQALAAVGQVQLMHLYDKFFTEYGQVVGQVLLTKENFAGIARIMLRELTESLSAKGFTFTYDDTLVDYLVDKSYSAAYGARNLRRCIQKELEDPMAVRIIESFDHPITHIRASASGEKVTLETL